MKKISILFYLAFSFFTFLSCEQQDEISPLNSTDTQISIDEKSQITLEPTILTKEEIENSSCGEVKTTTLFAGQQINVGEIQISNDEENLYVTYNVNGSWKLKETHLFVGTENSLPLTGNGNPKIGHFPYHGTHDLTDSYTFSIPLDQLDACFMISAHAVVVKNENGNITSSETAFGFGEKEFPGSRWGWYFNYCEQVCDDDKDDNDDNDNDVEIDDCLNAFAYNASIPDRSHCFFTDTEESTYGWSNEFNIFEQAGKHYELPLYAKVDHCDPMPETGPEIGYVDIYLFSEGDGDGMQLFATVKYIINDTYELTEANLNLHFNSNGFDATQILTNGSINYNYQANNSAYWNSSENAFEKIPWPGVYNDWGTFFIPNVMVCKAETSN